MRARRGVSLTGGGLYAGTARGLNYKRTSTGGERHGGVRPRKRTDDLWDVVCWCGWSSSGSTPDEAESLGATHVTEARKSVAAKTKAKAKAPKRPAPRDVLGDDPRQNSRGPGDSRRAEPRVIRSRSAPLDSLSVGSLGGQRDHSGLYRLGDLRIADEERWSTLDDPDSRWSGGAYHYGLTTPTLRLDVVDVVWGSGRRDVRVLEVTRGDDRWNRLRFGFRLVVHQQRGNRWFIPLDAIPVGNKGTRTRPVTDKAELDRIAGCNFEQRITKDFGATGIFERADIVDHRGSMDRTICVVFDDPEQTSLAPIVAFGAVPVLAFARHLRRRP